MIFTCPAEQEILLRWRSLEVNKNKWPSKVGKSLSDRDHLAEYIEFCRKIYVCPDYKDLVGLPEDRHYDESGKLSLERKAQLLLVGVFSWNDYYITKMDKSENPEDQGWLAVSKYDQNTPLLLYNNYLERPYKKEESTDFGSRQKTFWFARRKRNGIKKCQSYWGAGPGKRDYFSPFEKLSPKKLEYYLIDTERCSVYFRDRNHYNTSPNNLIPVKGRHLHCAKCGDWIIKENSKEIRDEFGNRQRRSYCFKCLGVD